MTREELKLKYPIGTTFKVIKNYEEAKVGDVVKLIKYANSESSSWACFSNDDYKDVKLYLPYYSTPEVELYEVSEFKKGDYIVLLDTLTTDTSFPKNHIFKQIKNYHYLLSELDINGSKTNGWCLVNFSKKDYRTNYNWRYATETEIAEYNRLGKPYDVTTLQTEKPIEKSLVGRYLKAKVASPWGISDCKKNDYLIITDSNHCYVINDKNKTEWTFANNITNGLPHSDFELMPEGFTPDNDKTTETMETLPDKWCIKVTDENKDILTQWVTSHSDFEKGIYLPIKEWVINEMYDGSYQNWNLSLPANYTEITLDQFKQLVLKQSDKPQFEVGKWYKSNIGTNYWYYIKVESVEYKNDNIFKVRGVCIRENPSKFEFSYWDSKDSISQALELGPLTDLSEIQSTLPDGHPDKIKPMINMQEIQEEAKRRFPIGCKFKSISGDTFVLELDQVVYSIHDTNIYAHDGAGLLYGDSKWAELLELPESESWVPKVGDWIYLIKSYRNLPIGTVAKINDSDVCSLSNPEESCFCISNYVGFACRPFKSHCRKAEPHEIPANKLSEVAKLSMNKFQAIEYFKQFNIVEGTRYIATRNVRGKNPYISKADKRWNFVESHITGEKRAITNWLDCGDSCLWQENNPYLAIIIPDYVQYNSKMYYVNNVIDFNTYELKCNNGELINVSINNCNPLWQYNGKSFDEIIFRGIASELEDFKFFTPLVKYYKFDIDPFEEPVKQKVNKTNRLEMLPLKQMQIL